MKVLGGKSDSRDKIRISLAFNLYSIPLGLDWSSSDYKSKIFYS